jgi:hypothetical protein
MAGCASPKGVVTTKVGRLQRIGIPQILHNRNSFSTKWQCDFQNKDPLSTQSVGADYFFTQNNHSQCVTPSSNVQGNCTEENRHFQQPLSISISYFSNKKHTNSLILRQIILKHALKHTFSSSKNI